MRIGCSASFAGLDIVQKAGFDYVVLRGKDVAAAAEFDLAALHAALARTGLPCASLNAYCADGLLVAGPHYSREENLAYAKRLAPRAAALGVETIGIGSPPARRIPEEYESSEALRQFGEFLSDTAEVFAQHSISVSLEPLGYCYCNLINRTEEAAELVSTLSQRVGLTLDFYNMERSGEADMDLQPYGSGIDHVHISDDWGDCYRRAPLKPSRYTIHSNRLQRLRACGYKGDITLEIDVSPALEDIAPSAQFLRRVWGE